MPDGTDRPGEDAAVERLTKELEKLTRVADLFRQQRDSAMRNMNDLQVELTECRYELEQLTGSPPGG